MIRRALPFIALAALAALLLALYLRMHAVRDHPAPEGPASGAPAADAPAGTGRRVIFIGLDGADWNLIDGYVASGTMPNLAGLVRQGRSGILTTLHPPLSPLVWTSMMTGVGPLDHGILDFTRFNPAGGLREPITSDERLAPAIWNMASSSGRSVAVVGLWATYPAERVNGLVVSDRLFSYQYAEASPPPGVVFPPEREEWARRALRRAEARVDLAALRVHLPWLGEAEYRRIAADPDPYARPASALRRILVETGVFHDLARAYLAEARPDLAVVYFQGTDAAGHLFAPYLPPRQEGIAERDVERYGRVPETYFRHVDSLLGEYRDLAREAGAVLMIASDHGFFWKEGRPRIISSLAAATAGRWHRDEGIYLLWGPGVDPAPGRGQRGSVQQTCATLLALLGLPEGTGLSGPPLAGVTPATGPPRDYRAAFRRAEAEPRGGGVEAADAEALARLRALGYVGSGEPAAAGGRDPAHATRTPGSYNNEGLILRDQGKADRAVAAFEKALDLDPRLASALWNLSDLLFVAGRDPGRSDDLLVKSLEAGSPEGVRNLINRTIACQRAGDPGRSLRILDAAVAARPGEPDLWIFRGRYRVERRDCRGALSDFQRAARLAPHDALVPASEGLAHLCLGEPAEAEKDFRRSLAIDPDQPEVRRYLEQGS